MSVVALIGAQWGDEGKGHLVDLLASKARLVVRYGGGNNAGHTVVNHLGTFKLHLIPSGIFDPATVNVIGSGVVISPEGLLQELEDLKSRGVSTSKLFISERAHVIMPYHIMLDRLQEEARGDDKIGTTGRGIGPAYADKMNRSGIRMADLLHEETLLNRLRSVLEEKNRLLTKLYGAKPLSLHDTYLRYLDFGHKLADHITDTHPIIMRALEKDMPILLEGAQGSLLDVDYGTYPYVTSSPPGAAGACQGSGIGPTRIDSVIGVYKAYTTRVGQGPFPTEIIEGPDADGLRQIGKPWAEVGTTTGRLRRVGWFDAVMARYAAQINGIDTLAITKLDVLDELPSIKICTGYKLHDAMLEYPPATTAVLDQVEPVYEEMPGWMSPTSEVRRFQDLPEAAQAYVARICQLVGARLGIISVGPDREQTIIASEVF
nr:adenylosuccinate synthase [Oscillochloris trichoides]